MTTRRRYLTLLGASTTFLAGCGGNTSSSTPTETQSNPATDTPTPEEAVETDTESMEERINQNIEENIPLDGLGKYTEKILEAEAPNAATTQEIDQILEGENQDPETLRNQLDDVITTDNIHQVMRYFHQNHNDKQNTIIANKNWRFTGQSDPTIEIYTVQNGKLQPGPTLTDTYNNKVNKINKPNQNKPKPLADLRDPTDGSRRSSTDYQAMQELMDSIEQYEGLSEEDEREIRETTFSKMSCAVPGLDPEDNFIFYDGENANLVTDVLREGNKEAAQAYTQLANKIPEAEGLGEEGYVSAEYTGSDWKLRHHPDWEPGDKLPGEQ
jgi:hypothetical protein